MLRDQKDHFSPLYAVCRVILVWLPIKASEWKARSQKFTQAAPSSLQMAKAPGKGRPSVRRMSLV